MQWHSYVSCIVTVLRIISTDKEELLYIYILYTAKLLAGYEKLGGLGWVRLRAGGGLKCERVRGAAPEQCSIFTGIGPEAESNHVTLRIKYGICPGISGIYPNPAAESKLG